MIRNESTSQPSTKPSLILRAVLLVINILFGFVGFFFFMWYWNVRAASSSLILGVVCCLFLHLTYTVMRGMLTESYNYRRFKFIFIITMVIGVSQLVTCIAYVILGKVSKERFHFAYGFYVAVIPSSMASLWSFFLAYESKSYMGQLGEFSMGVAPQ